MKPKHPLQREGAREARVSEVSHPLCSPLPGIPQVQPLHSHSRYPAPLPACPPHVGTPHLPADLLDLCLSHLLDLCLSACLPIFLFLSVGHQCRSLLCLHLSTAPSIGTSSHCLSLGSIWGRAQRFVLWAGCHLFLLAVVDLPTSQHAFWTHGPHTFSPGPTHGMPFLTLPTPTAF